MPNNKTPKNYIEFKPTRSDKTSKILPEQHKQRIVTENGAVGISNAFTRKGEFYDLSKAAFLIKGLGLYNDLRKQRTTLSKPAVSGRSFERAMTNGDGISYEGLEWICNIIVDEFIGEGTHALGAQRQDLLQALITYARKNWVPMLPIDGNTAFVDALALGLFLGHKNNTIEVPILQTFHNGILPQDWFEGGCLGWFIKASRQHHEITQEQIAERLHKDMDFVRTLRRWENTESHPTSRDASVLAMAFYPHNQGKRENFSTWIKIACLIDKYILDQRASLNKPIPKGLPYTNEFFNSVWEESLRCNKQQLFRTILLLQKCTKTELKDAISHMKCGAAPFPHNIINNIKKRASESSAAAR